MLQALFISASAIKEASVPVDTSSLKKLIILNDDSEIVGNVTAQTNDSIYIVTDSGMTLQIPISSINKIYYHDYYTKNNVYIDAGYLLLIYYYNINYERMLTEYISLRLGYGYAETIGSLAGGCCNKKGENLNILFNLLLFEGNSKVEIGLGVSYIGFNKYYLDYNQIFSNSFSIGYRYQPKYGGIFFKVGISKFYPGAGLNLSLGYTF